jgi:hypothetical protein
MAKTAGGVAVVAHAHSADHFADEVIAFDLRNGTLRMTLATLKMVEPAAPSPLHYVATGRVILPVAGAQRLAIALFDYLKKQGIEPADIVGASDASVN